MATREQTSKIERAQSSPTCLRKVHNISIKLQVERKEQVEALSKRVVSSCGCARMYKDGSIIPLDDSLGFAANYSHMLGYGSPQMKELMRLYVTIHRFRASQAMAPILKEILP